MKRARRYTTIQLDIIHTGDCLEILKTLPDDSVHCCVTSPPYYALRDYGMEAQIGRETTPKEYISRLTEVFTEVRRVLRPDGTLWLNISDTYAGKGNQGDFIDPKNPNGRNGQAVALNNKVEGCKPKDMIGIPWMLAFALRDTGWYAETQISLSCEGYEFKTKGKTVVQNGWKAIEELFKASLKTKEKDDPMKSLPEVHEGDVLDGVSASVTEHFTTPPKQYTEDTLLSAMETAGNDQFDDDTEKKGLGTPATRAGIIEKLVKSGFAERKGKSLIPTKDGCNLVCVLPEQITSPAMTAEWENTLMEIERGNADADAFLSGIVRMTGDLVKAYPFLSDAEAQRFGTGKEEIGKCPRCGSPVYVGKGNFYCSNKECSFCLWEDNKFFSSKKKKLTKKIAKELLDKGWCRVTGLYTPKKPQLYEIRYNNCAN